MKTLLATLAISLLLTMPESDKSRDIEKRIQTQPSQRIEINGFNGSDITFKSWDKNEVYLKLNVSISSSDESYERDYIESVNVIDSQTANAVILTFREPTKEFNGKTFWGTVKSLFVSYIRKKISGEIYVPQSNPLSTDMKYGSLSLENMRGSVRLLGRSNTVTLKNCSTIEEVQNDYGKTTIENSGGNLQIEGRSGTITIDTFNGPISADAEYSTITIGKIKEKLSIKSRSAKLKLEDIQGDLSVNSDYSNITINNVSGFVDVGTKSGTVKVKQVEGINIDADYTKVEVISVSGKSKKEIIINGRSGSLILEDAVGDLKIDNPYSKMDLKKIRGNVELRTTSATVRAEDIIGDWTSYTEYATVTLDNLTAQTISMTNKSNPIEVQLKNAPNKISIKNQYGRVDVEMPQGFSGEVNLESEYGKIDTNLPIKSKNLGSGAYGMGKIGTGNGSINIETKSANIKLIQR
ncbi:MAG: DUF4097 family beta strand repeat protein [Ignavibacteriales bacterium]|nr:DUF4097 family beta strand repeat protein [Ignavibacteriales bacterium]